jgi:hypothetical protein
MPFIGLQETDVPGARLALANCQHCGSIGVIDLLRDVSRCMGCGEDVVGDSFDPKICCSGLVYCEDCGRAAEKAQRVALASPPEGPRAWKMVRDEDALAVGRP